jgi:hypothetical protein
MLTGVLLLLAGMASPRAQQDAQPPVVNLPRTLTLTGCVEKGNTPNQFTINDPTVGKFEVSGNRIQRYVGQRVQVAGTRGSTRFRAKGGLWPNPNVAAQGGHMDPARAAVAAQPGGPYAGTGEIDLPTFKVKSVRTVSGECE